MPLPSDEKIVALSDKIIQQFDSIFGLHPGFRPAHAKGLLLSGAFTPAPHAIKLTRAPHIRRASTPVTVRFSNSTGLPLIPDNDANADPRGLAIRFHLAEHVHTDIVSHSTDGFPTRTGEEFLDFLQAVAASGSSQDSPSPIQRFLGAHPAALAFVQTPKPMPASFATENYFGVTAMRFIDESGASRHGRYRILPESEAQHLSTDEAKTKGADFLFDELKRRVESGPIRFHLRVHLAKESDIVDDATIHWPEDREIAALGTITLTGVTPDNAREQQQIIFDPIPRVDGIEPSADPLLELRAAVYLLTGRRRRKAPQLEDASHYYCSRAIEMETDEVSLDNGIVTVPSRHSFYETVQKLEKILTAKGIKLFAVVDHSGAAKEVGMEMPSTKLLIFGDPKAGTPLMLASPSIAIDLPLKILISQDRDGKVLVSYNAPAYLQARHSFPVDLVRKIAGIETLAKKTAE